MRKIKGCNALLTGASRGLGVSIATRFAEEGVNLALVARTSRDLEHVRNEVLQKGVRAIAVSADLTRLDSLESLVQTVERDLGPIDLLINNAAVEDIRKYESLSREEIEATIALNLTAPMILSRLVIPRMLTRKRGHIVNISSAEGLVPLPFSETYSATKHALIGFSYCLHLACQLQKHPVGASVICPSAISGAGMYQRYLDALGDQVKIPGFHGTYTPEDVADAVIRSIRCNKTVIVVGRSLLPLHFLLYAFPRFVERCASALGLFDPLKYIVESHTRKQ